MRSLTALPREAWAAFSFTCSSAGQRYSAPPLRLTRQLRKWQIVEFWDKYGRVDSAMSLEPSLPHDIRNEALLKVSKLLRVFTWDEWKR